MESPGELFLGDSGSWLESSTTRLSPSLFLLFFFFLVGEVSLEDLPSSTAEEMVVVGRGVLIASEWSNVNVKPNFFFFFFTTRLGGSLEGGGAWEGGGSWAESWAESWVESWVIDDVGTFNGAERVGVETFPSSMIVGVVGVVFLSNDDDGDAAVVDDIDDLSGLLLRLGTPCTLLGEVLLLFSLSLRGGRPRGGGVILLSPPLLSEMPCSSPTFLPNCSYSFLARL